MIHFALCDLISMMLIFKVLLTVISLVVSVVHERS